MDVRFSIQAELDLEEIGDAIAAENPSAALRFIRDIRQHCERIATEPPPFSRTVFRELLLH